MGNKLEQLNRLQICIKDRGIMIQAVHGTHPLQFTGWQTVFVTQLNLFLAVLLRFN